VTAGSQPALAVFNNILIAAYTTASSKNPLFTVQWNPVSETWGSFIDVKEFTWGNPSLFVDTEKVELHMLFATNDGGRAFIEMKLEISGTSWSRVTPPNEQTAFGVASTQWEE
jgi:hypothetical protein